MNKLKIAILAVLSVVTLSGASLTPAYAAACNDAKSCIQVGVDAAGGTNTKTTVGDLIKTIVNALLFILGAVAVIMIVIGGIRYTTSNGDASHVKAAKDTILYAVVGLVVAMLAYAIVYWVVVNIGK